MLFFYLFYGIVIYSLSPYSTIIITIKYIKLKALLKYISFVFLLLISSPSFTQSYTMISCEGLTEIDHISYFNKVDNKIDYRLQLLLNLDLSTTINNNISFISNLELRLDLADKLRDRIFLDEFYMNIYTKNADFSFGRQIINWGQSDSYNPLNNINPTDLSDILDTEDEILPVYASRIKYYLNNLTFDLVLVPIFTPSKIPHISRSRWGPTGLPLAIPDPVNEGVMYDAIYSYNKKEASENLLDDFQFGMKINYNFPGWDVALSHYYGKNDIANFVPEYNFIADMKQVKVGLNPDFFKWHVTGLDFSTSFGEYGFKGEAGYFIPEKTDYFDKGPNFIQFVLGFDKTFVNVIRENNLFVIVEWIQEIVPSGDEYESSSFNHVFQRSLFVRLEQQLSNYGLFTLQSIYDFKSTSLYLVPTFSYDIVDGCRISLSGNIIATNNEKSFFYPYKKNDRLQAKLRYNF